MDKEERNYQDVMKGIEYEKKGDTENAIKMYEKLIKHKFDGSHPYDRLMILYRKRKDYISEERVLLQAISMFTKITNDGRCDGPSKLERYKKRLDSLHKKMNI